MRLQPGADAPAFALSGLDEAPFDSRALQGRRRLVAFFRFATCPFCNLRLRALVEAHARLDGRLQVVALFDSSLADLRRHAARNQAPFPVLADEDGAVYRAWGIERSAVGMVKGMVLRMPTLLQAMGQGLVPASLGRGLTTMPADFLVDENGVVEVAHYGTDEGDHLPLAEILAYAEAGRAPAARAAGG